MTTTEERLSRIEGGYEHLATKADLANLRADFKTDLGNLKSELTHQITIQTRWLVGGIIAMMGVVVALDRLWQ